MKLGLSSKIRLFILLAMLISISSYFSLLFFISGSDIEKNLKNDLSNIIWGSLILNFGLSLYLIGNIGNYIHKSLAAVRFLIQEISKGNYNVLVDIPCDTDPEIQNVMGSLDYMQEVILHYDNLKKEKIVENRNR
ncbi:MAG: hypothetical protein KA886_09190, partial [Candidatus Cloacimonetes bacterium]|nr:hypothetical protein [Candidatus Cloacimonadota bacterium]